MTKHMTAAKYNKTTRAKPRDIEGPIQIEIVDWLRANLPTGCMVHHCKNEIKRGGGTYAREQAKATRMGMIGGWPDLIVVTYVGVLFFEVKAPKGRVQDNQKDVHAALTQLGYRVAVVRSVADVRERLFYWGIGTRAPLVNIPVRGTINGGEK